LLPPPGGAGRAGRLNQGSVEEEELSCAGKMKIDKRKQQTGKAIIRYYCTANTVELYMYIRVVTNFRPVIT
jgi:hypothetical protein